MNKFMCAPFSFPNMYKIRVFVIFVNSSNFTSQKGGKIFDLFTTYGKREIGFYPKH